MFTIDGAPMMEFADDHVTATSFLNDGETTAWREWEIEFLGNWTNHPDSKTVMAAMSKVTEVASAVPSESPSGLVAALGNPISSTPLPSVPAKLSEGTLECTVVDVLAANVVRMVEYDLKVRHDKFGSIRQMHVATREPRSRMQIFHDIVVGDKAADLENNLRQLA